MAYVDWLLKGKRLVACSCDYGCPCEFMAAPTQGHCEGLEGMEVDEGYFGDVRLDGVRFAGTYHWPGPVHEGKGTYQAVVDESTTEEQREALFKILSGEEQEPTTAFNIYGSTIETELDPIFTHVEFAWDLKNRTGRVFVPGVAEADFEPIRNPVTGEPHEARLVLPTGFEFREAQMANASRMTGSGDLKFDYANCYGSLCYVAYGPYGIIDEAA